jgi:hypothetical protein
MRITLAILINTFATRVRSMGNRPPARLIELPKNVINMKLFEQTTMVAYRTDRIRLTVANSTLTSCGEVIGIRVKQ